MVATNGDIVGVTECRFEPLHKGHVYMTHMSKGLLAEKARELGTGYKMHVIVTSHDGEEIPGDIRYMWAQKTLGGDPNMIVHSAHNALEHINGYGSDYNGPGYTSDWNFWGKVATEMCGLDDTIDYVFGSESYVEGIASACGAKAMKIDEDRESMQVSGTIMRQSPYLNWDNFPDAVKPFFAKKICITGGPYTGKARLAKELSKHYNTPMVGDVSSNVYNHHHRGCTPSDLEQIATLHTVHANALLEQANRVIISDSDTLLSRLWFDVLFGEPPERLKELSDTKRFDLYVLMDSEGLDFRPSNSFGDPKSWHNFTQVIKDGLDERGWPYIVLNDSMLPKRYTDAVVAIDDLRWETDNDQKMSWVPGMQKRSKYIVNGKKL